MAPAPLILQHNWTGVLALYAPAPSQPRLANPVKGVSSNSRAQGSWIKAITHARLRIHDSNENQCIIELHLQEDMLLRCPLSNQRLSMKLLTSSATRSGNVLMLASKRQSKLQTAAPVCYCFRFFDDSDCHSFQAALEATKKTRYDRLVQEQRLLRRQQQQQAADRRQQQKQTEAEADKARNQQASVSGDAACAVLATNGHAVLHSQPPVLIEQGVHAQGLSQQQIKDVIKHYLLDPSFQSYVDSVEALWDEVEQEVLGQITQDADAMAMEI